MMGDRRRGVREDRAGRGKADASAAAPPVATGAVSGVGAAPPDPTELAERPRASGHRFGPGLVCSECGTRWDAHQRKPEPCVAPDLPDPFARRPIAPR